MPGFFSVDVLDAAITVLQMPQTPKQQTAYLWMFVLLSATPYLLLAVIGGGIFRARRRQRQQEVESLLQEQLDWEVARAAADPDAAR